MMQTPQPSTPHLDRLLHLTIKHEDAFTQQQMLLTDILSRVGALEVKRARDEKLLGVMQGRNIIKELDQAQAAVAQVADALAELRKSTQGSETSAADGEVAKLRKQVKQLAKAHAHFINAQEKAAKQAETLPAGLQAVRTEVEQCRGDATASCSAVEAAQLQSSGLVLRLRAQVASTGEAQTALSARLDAMDQQAAKRSQQALESDNEAKRVKKHVVKLSREVQTLQAAAHLAVNADGIARQLRHDFESLQTSTRESISRADATSTSGRELALLVQQIMAQQQQLVDTTAARGRDLVLLAETIGTCFEQLNDGGRRPHSGLQGYYAGLLGPAAGGGLVRSGGPGGAGLSDWDATRSDYSRFLQTFRVRNATEYQAQTAQPLSMGQRLAG